MNESTTLLVLIIGSVFAFLAALYMVLATVFSYKRDNIGKETNQISKKRPSSK